MKKIAAIILIAIVAVSALSLLATAYARPFMNWRTFGGQHGNSHRFATQQSFVRVDGWITNWGETNATGGILAQSRTVVINSSSLRQGSSANAIWTTNGSRPIAALRNRENFTYSFYSARIVNANTSSLNVTGYSLFLNGTWNVNQVTTTFTITTDDEGNITSVNRSQNAVPMVTEDYGELKIATTGTFSLTINGIDELTGTVRVQRIASKTFNPFRIHFNDALSTVTKADVASVVSCYGASPGWGNYDQRMDYNFNYKVDIFDLTTAAANVNA